MGPKKVKGAQVSKPAPPPKDTEEEMKEKSEDEAMSENSEGEADQEDSLNSGSDKENAKDEPSEEETEDEVPALVKKVQVQKKRAPVKKNNNATFVVQTKSTFDILVNAMLQNEDKKGISIAGIKSFLKENHPEKDWVRFKPHVKKALAKGIESGDFYRPKISENATGLSGRFKLQKDLGAKKDKPKKAPAKEAAAKKNKVKTPVKKAPVKKVKGKDLAKKKPPAKKANDKNPVKKEAAKEPAAKNKKGAKKTVAGNKGKVTGAPRTPAKKQGVKKPRNK